MHVSEPKEKEKCSTETKRELRQIRWHHKDFIKRMMFFALIEKLHKLSK